MVGENYPIHREIRQLYVGQRFMEQQNVCTQFSETLSEKLECIYVCKYIQEVS